MILAWVISLLLLCTALVTQLERLASLRAIEVQTIERAQQNFMNAEQAVIDCENHLVSLSMLNENLCFIEPMTKNIWQITSKQKPAIQIQIALDEKSGITKRINWRQVFE